MKRGLVSAQLPDDARAACAERRQRLGERLRDAGLEAALIYGDVSRSDDISYLGHLCLYWNEGVLIVPASGEPTFATKLSPRVHRWMRASSALTELRSAPNLAKPIGEVLVEVGGKSIRAGLVERDWWPGALVDELSAAMPEAELSDLGDVVRRDRLVPDDRELETLCDLGRAVARAVASAGDGAGTPSARVGSIEGAVRAAGMTDVFASAEDAADGSATAGAVAQRDHLWLRASRSHGGPLAEQAAAGAARAAAALIGQATPAALRAAVTARAAGGPADIDLGTDCVRHVDLACDGGARQAADDGLPFRPGEVVAVAVTASGPAGRATRADTYVVGNARSRAITVANGVET